MTNSRDVVIERSLDLIRAGGTVSLESAARAIGLTKPGVIYHFPTKHALMCGLVDAVADDWLHGMAARLPAAPESVSVSERVAAYLDECLDREADPSDIVMLSDPRLRDELTARWAERLHAWFSGLEALLAAQRGHVSAVRLMADGIWFATATGINPPTLEERPAIRAAAQELLAKVEA